MAYDGQSIKELDPSLPASTPITQPTSTKEWDDAIREAKNAMVSDLVGFIQAGQAGYESVNVTQAIINSTLQRLSRWGGQMNGSLYLAEVSKTPVTDPEVIPKFYVDQIFQTTPTEGTDYPCGYIQYLTQSFGALRLQETYEQAHSEAVVPDVYITQLRCITPEHGYLAGEVAKLGRPQSNDTNGLNETGGIQRYADTSLFGIRTGSNVWILDKAGAFVKVTPPNWELLAKVGWVTCDVFQPCTPSTAAYEEISAPKGNLQTVFMDRTNNVALSWHTGASAGDVPIMAAVDALTNTLLNVRDGAVSGTANRAYGFGYSSQGDGAIDRYVFFYRTGIVPGQMAFLIFQASNFIGGSDTSFAYGVALRNGDSGVSFGVETKGVTNPDEGFCVYSQVEIQAWQKNAFTADQVTVVGQTSTLAGHTYDNTCMPINMPDQTFFMQSWKKDNGFWAFGPYTPTVAGGTISAPVESTLPHASRQLSGSTYDGTHGWYAYTYVDGVTQNHLLKIDLTGAVVEDYDLGEFNASGGTDNWHTLDYDPVSGKIAIFWGDGNVRFFDPVLETFTTASIATGGNSGRQKYNGTACLVFTTRDYDFGLGDRLASAAACVTCA